MATRIGTAHFVSRAAADRYFAEQGCSKADVECKVARAEIMLGMPEQKPGYVLGTEDGRYFYQEYTDNRISTAELARRTRGLAGLPSKPEPVLPKIRFIVHTVTSERDSNGNSYHVATVRSTITGKLLAVINVGGTRNVPGQVMRASGDWEHQDSSESTLPKREHRALEKRLQAGDNCVMEHLLTAEIILALER